VETSLFLQNGRALLPFESMSWLAKFGENLFRAVALSSHVFSLLFVGRVQPEVWSRFTESGRSDDGNPGIIAFPLESEPNVPAPRSNAVINDVRDGSREGVTVGPHRLDH
jgi:hypothetical protein